MGKQPTRLIPLRPYLVGGHFAFLIVVIVVASGLMSPFIGLPTLDVASERHWRTLIPAWLSLVLQGNEWIVLSAVGLAYPLCLGSALVIWMIHERQARRYMRERRK